MSPPSRIAADARSVVAVDEFVASCVWIGSTSVAGEAGLCISDLRGELDVLDKGITPGVRPALSPDRRRIATAEGDSVVIRDVEGAEQVRLDVAAVDIQWMPDGRELVVQQVDSDGTTVSRIAPAGATPTILVRPEQFEGAVEQGIALSPDGSEIAFATRVGDLSSLRVIDLGSQVIRTLFESPEFVQWPDWSPDGSSILVVVGDDIVITDPRWGGQVVVLDAELALLTPSWAPDSRGVIAVEARGAVLTQAQIGGPVEIVIDRSDDYEAGPFPALPSWT